jgi:hypothetical protein
MKRRTLRNSIAVLSVGLIAIATVSIGAHSAAAANAHHTRHAYASHPYPRAAYASHRQGPWFARGATLPYGPEYGFLRRLPPNTIAGPGYTFVPGVGILGESCDLPTSACTNEYRDVK